LDRRRRPAAVLAVSLGLAAAAAAAAFVAPGDPPIRAMAWIARDADPARALGTVPAECLRRPDDPALALKVEVGRAAFRTPVLLGGQAGRVGIACETCHRGGRDNPDFQFPGVSGAPGTADVTNSLFSTHRGNGIDDPRPIPDLSGPKGRLKVDQALAGGKLEAFIHGLVTEEFDGPEPPPTVLQGLAAYVRALQPAACPAGARTPLTVGLLMSDARRALAAARAEARAGDAATAVLMVASARSRLGQIDERFAGAGSHFSSRFGPRLDPGLAAEHRALLDADGRLAALQAALRAGRPDAPAEITAWLARAPALEAALDAKAGRSLFDPARLAAAAAARRRLPAQAGGV
jgi:hypothetical protein